MAIVSQFSRRVIDGLNISEVKAVVEGGKLRTIEHSSPPGDDSFPIKDDSFVIADTQESGGGVAVGYFDTKNAPKALEGEKRIYARDSSGASIGELWIKADGSMKQSNPNGSFELKADGSMKGLNSSGFFEFKASGDFVVNGAIISAAGVITDATGKVLGTHVHPISSGSSAPGPTGPPA